MSYFESIIDNHYRKKSSKMIEEIESLIQPMDLILCKTNFYLSNLFIPGYWSHVVIKNWDGNYVGSDISKNVISLTSYEALAHRSSLCLLRCNLPII